MEKLVRNRIPDIIRASGVEPTYRIGTAEELPGHERAKVLEEIGELLGAATREEQLKEAGDAVEAIETFCKRYGITFEEILAMKEKRKIERGGMDDGILLEMDDPSEQPK